MRSLLVAFLVAVPLLAPPPSAAQDSRTVRLVVPFAAGGPADALARAIGPAMSSSLGQSIVIDNRGGAGGVLGVDTVAKAAPDGTTIGLGGVGAMTVLPFMRPVPYDVLRDLAPITLVARNSGVLVVHPRSGFRSLGDLVAHARSNPKKVNFASAGTGTSIHLSGELFAVSASIQLVHVPYAKGAAPAITDLLGGHVDMMLPDISGVLEHVRSGALVALAVTGEKRSPQLPDVPTMGEAGYPKVVSETWFGMIAPAKTPPAVRKSLHDAAMAALKSADVIKLIALQGSVPAPMSPEQFRALIEAEQAKWKPVIDSAGLKAQ